MENSLQKINSLWIGKLEYLLVCGRLIHPTPQSESNYILINPLSPYIY